VLEVPWGAFTPSFRGTPLAGRPALSGEAVRQLGFMLSRFASDGLPTPAFRPGAFKLRVRSVGALLHY
jgi:hypothetical protein